jgi:hypothetical protein
VRLDDIFPAARQWIKDKLFGQENMIDAGKTVPSSCRYVVPWHDQSHSAGFVGAARRRRNHAAP